MENKELQDEINKLSKLAEQQDLLNFELEGYMEDSQRRKIFREHAVHRVKLKKKHAYIDYGVEGNQSGKYMIQTVNEARKNKGIYPIGSVFSIKAYGQKGRYEGHIKDVVKEYEKNNDNFIKAVKERSMKRRF